MQGTGYFGNPSGQNRRKSSL